MENLSPAKQRARIFISYKRNVEPDEPVAIAVFEALSKRHDVFIDRTMLVGAPWAKRIDEEIARADFLITLLSEHSIQSEMVQGEIETAHRLGKERNGSPKILPVRLDYHAPFKYPLSAYLNPINWAYWKGPQDTANLIEELTRAISGGELDNSGQAQIQAPDCQPALTAPLPSAQPLSFDMPEGTISTDSKFYVERSSDGVALNAIEHQGVTITIKGPRQMGKSSLLIRALKKAVETGKRAVFLDYQLIERDTLTDAERFYRRFCDWVTDELEMENRVGEFWDSPLGNSQRCTRYFSRYLLKELGQPLALAMDEVENLFDTPFRSDFFSMLRSWHNARATSATSIWKRLDLALVTSTEPYQLIENLNQSPFNVGEVINLEDFTRKQVADLNQRHGAPLSTDEERLLMNLLNGHPYLTRRALYLVATSRISVADLFAKATDDRGPFGDHLRYHLFRIHDKDDLVAGLCDVMRRNTCDDEAIFFRLRGAGLVERAGQAAQMRCQLYADYFREHLKCHQR